MGLELHATFADDAALTWPALRDALAAHNYPVQMRMIDGELAFPDEEPPEAWTELRVGTPAGMVTLRRTPGRLTAVIWGNADDSLCRAWQALMLAAAEVTGGKVGDRSAEEFARSAPLPESWR